MSLRTDRVSGIITWVFGLVMIGFATFGLLIIAIQRAMIGVMPPMPMNPNEPGVSVIDAMYTVHGIWFVFLPLMIAGGIFFAFAGFRLQRGSTAARRLAQANAVCGYVWIVAYLFSCTRVMEVLDPPPGMVSGYLGGVFQFVSIGVGILMLAAFPTGLLFVLSRPDNRHTKPQSDTGDAM